MRRRRDILAIWLIVGLATVGCYVYSLLLVRLMESSLSSRSGEDVTTEDATLASIKQSASDTRVSKEGNLLGSAHRTIKPATKTETESASEVDAFQEKIWSGLNESKHGIHVFRPNQKAQSLILIGERHSGTTFLTAYFKDCFPGITVDDTFVNGKHWWQPTPKYVVEAASKFDQEELLVRRRDDFASHWHKIATNRDGAPRDYFTTAFVVAVFRNPYDWVEAMRRKPWHWPNHVHLYPTGKSAENQTFLITQSMHLDPKEGVTKGQSMGGRFTGKPFSVTKSLVGHRLLEWEEFVRRPLSLVGYNESLTSFLCQKGYPKKLISPCHQNTTFVPDSVKGIPRSFLRHLPFALNDPVYEHDTDGEPFGHLLQLRARKVVNFLSIPEAWNLHGFGVIQYESLVGNSLEIIKRQISAALRTNSSCPTQQPFQKKPYSVSDEFREFVARKSDWKIEKSIGFHML